MVSTRSATLPSQEPRDGGLGWMILVSAVLHAVVVGLAATLPSTLRDRSPSLVSYTVDLVAPDRLGGTNMPGPQPPGAPPKVAAAPPPAAAVEKPAPAAPEPAKWELKPAEPARSREEPGPKAEPEAEKRAEPRTAPVKVGARKEPAPKPEPKPAPKKEEAPAARAAAPKPPASPQAPVRTQAQPDLSPQEARAAIAARLREERIAAAVKRAQQRLQQSPVAAAGTGDRDSPASVGPGEGSGGILKGLEWLMYKNRVETLIRDNWVWTGADKGLEATVRFGITETGEVVDVRIEKPSGDPSYDASVERAVRMTSPLPPPPEAYRADFRDYELTFNAEFLQM